MGCGSLITTLLGFMLAGTAYPLAPSPRLTTILSTPKPSDLKRHLISFNISASSGQSSFKRSQSSRNLAK